MPPYPRRRALEHRRRRPASRGRTGRHHVRRTGHRRGPPDRRTLASDPATRRPPLRARRCRGGHPAGARFPARRRADRGARLEQLGRRRHADRQRQAAARQRPAPRHARAVDSGISRTCRRGDFDVIGATLPGAPAVALGRNRFIAWGATNVAADVEDLYRERLDADRHARRVPRRAGAAADHSGNDRGQGRRRRSSSTSASRATARSSPTRSTPTTRASHADAKAAAARAAGVPLDGARRRRLDASSRSCKLNEARNWTEFTAALRDFVVAVAELRLRRRRRPHRLLRARPHPDSRARRRFASPAEGWTGDDGVDRLDSVRGAAARLRSARALHRHRQPSAGAGRTIRICSASSGPSRIARSGSPICFAAATKLTPDDFARSRPTPCRCTRRRCCRCCLRTRARRRAAARRPSSSCAAWNFDAARRQRGRGDLRGVVPATRAGARRRRARSARDRRLPGPFLVRHAFRRQHADRPKRQPWCDDVTTPATGDLRRRGDDGAARRGRGSDAATRRRHRRAGAGTPCTARCFRTRGSTRWRRCGRSSAARSRTAATGAR